jgi:2-keto-4-pentenoate hydratase
VGLSAQAVAEAAGYLAEGRAARRAMAPLPEALRPGDPEEAYAVQDALHARLAAAGLGPGEGHKIGCTTPVMQAYLGIDHPCAGGVPAATARRGHGEFRHADFVRVGVECEIAVRLGSDLPGGVDRAGAAGAVAAVMAAIEVVDDRWTDFTAAGATSLIADDFFAAGCVLGDEAAPGADLAAVRGIMRVNGQTVGEGLGTDILGHPLSALAWLAANRAARGRPLRAGDFVLLGSVVKTQWLAAGDRVDVELDGLGKASAVFD